jgi:hypothetical protein
MCMLKAQLAGLWRRYGQGSKISVVSELESGKPPAQIAPSRVFIPFFRSNVEMDWLRSTPISIPARSSRSRRTLRS